MSLFLSSLNSGSNGNCYYVGNSEDAILVDAGLSCRETEKRMKRSGLSMGKVRGIFISHEHADHVRGVETISLKFGIPVYISEGTLKSLRTRIEPSLVRVIHSTSHVEIGSLVVRSFLKLHDAADPHSFVIDHQNTRVGVFTDIGAACDNLIDHFSTCHAAILESNYDEKMLEAGPYPYILKKRIRGGHGHLSNAEALKLFTDHRPDSLKYLVLGHLSKDNNTPRIVRELFEPHAGSTKIYVASRDMESPVLQVSGTSIAELRTRTQTVQMSLF